MRIAIPCENGLVFQHFGHTEAFKVYDVEGDKVVSAELVPTEAAGHNALAAKLKELEVSVVICGGIGVSAQEALTEAGILLCPGASGDVDEAVTDFLRGQLQPGEANCDHHGEQHCGGDEPCGGGCGGCGGGCGGCGGGCGGSGIEGRNVGHTCSVHYRGTFNDGTQFDSSYDRGEPLTFVCGAGMMIRGFDAAVAEMEVGQALDIHLMPEEAYGIADPRVIFTVDMADLPGTEDLSVGDRVYLSGLAPQPVPVRVTARDEKTITFDANHEMAGKELNFHIELVSVE